MVYLSPERFSPLAAANFHDNAPLTKKRRNGEITENINYLEFRIIKTLLRSGERENDRIGIKQKWIYM